MLHALNKARLMQLDAPPLIPGDVAGVFEVHEANELHRLQRAQHLASTLFGRVCDFDQVRHRCLRGCAVTVVSGVGAVDLINL